MIPFNKPYLTGNEIKYIKLAVKSGKISGNGIYTQECQKFFKDHFGVKKAMLTTSCTDALEMCAMLSNIQPGDEVIVPSYTFVSTALAFIRQGAKIIFADSRSDHPGMDEDKIERLISRKTRAIIPVHYAGVACDMDKIRDLAIKHNILVIEDAAQAIDSYYKNTSLGSIGHLAAFSFHETKNINAGEGGLLAINDERFIKRAEIIWEKGTNRAEFFRGEVNKYNWVDIGSSFLPSELISAYLYAQLEHLDKIQKKRKRIWTLYYNKLLKLEKLGFIKLPYIPSYATNNAHMFYIVCRSPKERNKLLEYLRKHYIYAVFHYLSLHKSPFYKKKYKGEELYWSDYYADRIVRLPIYYELKNVEVEYIVTKLEDFYENK